MARTALLWREPRCYEREPRCYEREPRCYSVKESKTAPEGAVFYFLSGLESDRVTYVVLNVECLRGLHDQSVADLVK